MPPAFKLALTAPPAIDPVSLAEMKTHLRVDQSADDGLITALISAARETCERVTNLALITQGYDLLLDRWPRSGKDAWWDGVREGANVSQGGQALSLPRAPLQAVSAIAVYDAAGDASVLDASNYFVDTAGAPGRIVLKNGASMPQPGQDVNGIRISFIAGYGDDANDVPAALRQGIRQLAAHLYENRGDSAAGADDSLRLSGAAALFLPFRRMGIA